MRDITIHKCHEEDQQPKIVACDWFDTNGVEKHYVVECEGWSVGSIYLEGETFTNEALLAIVIDQLTLFQAGEFPCEENEVALNHCISALTVLQARTLDRIERKVKNKAKK